METAFDLLSWRNSLAHADAVPGTRDLIDWTQRLASAGEETAAALLAKVAALHQGFSPQALASQGTRWAVPGSQDHAAADPDDGTLHRAQHELRALARAFPELGSLGLVPRPAPRFSGRPDNPLGIGDGVPVPPVPRDIAAVAHCLSAALQDPAEEAGEAGDLLASLIEADRRLPTLDFRTLAHAPLEVLVPAIALAGLIDFALAVRDIATPPLGSLAFLRRAARFDGMGLGSYFSNVPNLVRHAQDVFDLAGMARDAACEAGYAGAAIEAWIVILGRECRGALLNEIIDELGDRNASLALSAMLDHAASRPAAAIDIATVTRVRDAGLDNGDFALAARAQRVVVRLHPTSPLASVILGSIEASGGGFAVAEDIFRRCLAESPDDAELTVLAMAAGANDFSAFAITQGFASPEDRRDLRLRRRGVPPRYAQRQGQRMLAVAVR